MIDVSVIMGVYNSKSKKELDRAINSILNQTLKNIEFIICNDGSTNETESWLNEYKNNSSVTVIKNDVNLGLAYSLNKCAKCASGKYIARQDADDYSELSRLEKQINFLEEKKEYTVVGTNINWFDNNGVYAEFLFPEKPNKKNFLFSSPFNHGSIMIRKEDFISIGGYRVSNDTLRCEDYDLFLRFFIKGYKMYNIQEKLYYFREDEDTKKRRNLKDRYAQTKVRKLHFRHLDTGVLKWFYILKPLLTMLIPARLLKKIKQKYYKRVK